MSANRLFWKCLIKKQQINLCEKRWKYSLKKKLFFRERRLITSDWNINLCFFAYWDLVERTLLHEHQSFISNRIGCTHETFLATCDIVGLMWICMRCAFSGFLILLLPSVAVNHNLHIENMVEYIICALCSIFTDPTRTNEIHQDSASVSDLDIFNNHFPVFHLDLNIGIGCFWNFVH